MHHYIYEIRNIVNGHVYVGKHSTNDLDDGYMGSGTDLLEAIATFGLESFRKKVLSYHPTEEVAYEAESMIVTKEFVERQDTYNLKEGGLGGKWGSESCRRGGHAMAKVVWSDPDFRRRHSTRTSQRNRRLHESDIMKPVDWTGRRHTDETKEKIGKANSLRQTGSGNSQYGTKWIHHLDRQISKRIPHDQVDAFLAEGWCLGRKMSFK